MGYIIDENQYFQIDPITAPLVLEAFTRYSQGATIKQLVDWLNEQGVKSASKRPMRIDCVQRMLKNRRYIGEYKYRDIVEPDAIPAIVPKDLFDRVQERLAKNKKAPARFKATEEQYLLTTKLFCGKCGAYMVGESGTSHTGKFHQYYKCVTAKKKQGCKKKTVKKDWIENIVVAETLAMLQDDNVLLYIIDTAMELQARENTSLPHLKQQLAETERSIKNMLDAIQQGIFNSSTKQRLDELEQTKSDLEVSILQEEMHRPLLTREQVAFFLHRFRDIDVTNQEQQQKLIDIFVNAIYLYDDKIVFTFNYKDGTKTITIADIEGSDLCTGGAPRRGKLRSIQNPQLFGGFSYHCVAPPLPTKPYSFAGTPFLHPGSLYCEPYLVVFDILLPAARFCHYLNCQDKLRFITKFLQRFALQEFFISCFIPAAPECYKRSSTI